jgi:hypothetical protein
MKHITFILTIVTFHCQAQSIANNKYLVPYSTMNMEVRVFDEFLSRFNYKTTFTGHAIDNEFAKNTPRSQYIRYLFDLQDERLKYSMNKKDNYYVDRVNLFIKQVCDTLSPCYISKKNNTIYAIITSKVNYQDQIQKKNFLFKLDYYNGSYAWKLWGIDSSFENYKIYHHLKLPPNSNEINFLNLFNELKEFDGTINKDNSFINLIKRDKLHIERTLELKYLIFDIEGWFIEVSYFNRGLYNSGWLISELMKNDKEPGIFTRDYFNIKIKSLH